MEEAKEREQRAKLVKMAYAKYQSKMSLEGKRRLMVHLRIFELGFIYEDFETGNDREWESVSVSGDAAVVEVEEEVDSCSSCCC